MSVKDRSRCEWRVVDEGTGVVGVCGRAPLGVIFDTYGERHFACRDHLSSIKARYGTGVWSVRAAPLPAWPYPESLP